jgi:pyruvate/2-oxoglutarate dehydrogenase complex dihydrolipoamide acyltransferase (E2) component
MNAESTYVRPPRPRPTLVPPPGGDGTRLAGLVLALPMRVAATPLGRRALAAAGIAVVLVSLVGALYDHADGQRPAAALAGAQATASRQAAPATHRRGTGSPAAKRGAGAGEAAAAWFAGQQRIAPDRVRALGQRRVSASEREVLVVAEAGASKVPSAYVVVRKGPDGWAAVS